ncbi:RNA polymerase sigma factor [Leifsonia sp. 21MFCrub1.1]|uniref:RNA polymerase sigma factor n=1 Tax=Leifsonia sp. 21MFCrub1.1 TaxID=1798223 RepID=UPI000892A119|nr:sigma-70 family RNA polymerase sigma factor [Leifsonia sp. 21MFCrub1.1]SEB02850.1 RNA polymerase sigma-70 factor, ECF subfamily [Leifsonia sp. 21MFCrub1.1]
MSNVGSDEADAWSRARDGDPDAFTSLFDKHRDRVFGHALRLVRRPHDAEDVTAMVFLEAWRRRDAVRVVDGSIIAWLLVATNNTVHNLERGRRRHRAALARMSEPGHEPDHADGVADNLDNEERDRRVRDAFASLSTADQNVITLCVLEELPLAEAARTLGVPVGTIKSRLSRAKRRLGDLTLASESIQPALEGGAE